MSMLSSVTVSKVTEFRWLGAEVGSSTAQAANATKKEKRIKVFIILIIISKSFSQHGYQHPSFPDTIPVFSLVKSIVSRLIAA